ncbi:MAG: 4-(cytidine 5'-diphospho)-2-C-methyl-D-erythritol kinase [Muribaculaceae bacterium]|nr:4-(cytidine 5'-diphospho)-2-C-methyl-D-erythritol kinase [Muribaculaceae bacterium]MDE7110510.1 4-(cytidine 5'-diphospho)-2-C-methyl-D-erythritol kinase [Muribaculaceae bacterium]
MILFPHAKINLGLDITGKRPDGYHTLETVMIPTDWEDLLELTQAEEIRLVCTGRKVDCPPEKNLVMKAFRLMESETGGLPPTLIHLHKNIPDGAGLGGGSADAAFTLRGLNDLYCLGIPTERLAALAGMLGSDCPFFIYDRPMLCTGTGTELQPFELQSGILENHTLAIIKPPFGISTKDAYAGVRPYTGHRKPLTERLALPLDRWQSALGNDFERPVIIARPQIGEIKARLSVLGAVYAQMSGSGSAVFGLFPKTDSDILSDLLVKEFPECAVHVSR